MTQDSFVWVIGLVSAVLAAILGFSGLLPPEVEKWLKIASAIVGAISLYLRGSPLPRSVYTPEQRAALQVDVDRAKTEVVSQRIDAVADAAKAVDAAEKKVDP